MILESVTNTLYRPEDHCPDCGTFIRIGSGAIGSCPYCPREST